MSRYDDIEEVKKSDHTDEIVEVEKFNPFHDSMGKFSSSHGFKSYSANPKTKAGAMAIQRSAAAGHGRTLNVHRESKGESIAQNDNWLKTGQKPKTPAAVSRARYQQRKQRLQQQSAAGGAQTTSATPKQTNTQANGKQTVNNAQNGTQSTTNNSLAQKVAGTTYTSSDKLALQSRNISGNAVTTKKAANDHDQARVAGKDIAKTFDYSKTNMSKDPIDAIAEAQGWNKGATVTNDKDVFNKAALQSGRVMMRTVDGYGSKNATQVCNDTMTDGNSPLGGSGGKAYGSGMYVVDTIIKGNSGSRMAHNVAAGQQESGFYGTRGNSKMMMATVHPDAKIATPSQAAKLARQYHNLNSADKARFGYDQNAYIASKGYDGAKWHRDSDPSAYTTMYNKSAMIFYGGVSDPY